TDGNKVDAGLGDRPNSVERDAAGRLELGAAGGHGDCLAKLLGRHVVEQDSIGAGFQRLSDLGGRVALDLDREAGRARAVDSLADRTDQPEMVVLDQDTVVEPETVIRTAPTADGVLLELAQAGRRLTGVEDDRACSVDRVDVAPGERRDPAEAADQVESESLA